METITFYSYKGGVGRTLTLANTAQYLSKFGLNVCVLDFDLEAPGLHYKFGIKSNDIEKGIVDYIHDFSINDAIPEKITDYAIEIEASGEGSVTVIPAGNVLKSSYWQKMSQTNIHDLIKKENNEGILFFLELKEKIANEIQPDFLLIDSRTGVTEIGGVSTSLLADKIVFLLANNDENLDGTTQILRSIKNLKRLSTQKPIQTTFVLTRIPFLEENREEFENDKKLKIIESFQGITDTIKTEDIVIIHSNRQVELNEYLAVTETKEQKTNILLNDYINLISKVVPDEIIAPNLNIRIKDIQTQMLDNPDKVQEDLESLANHFPHKITFEYLLKFYLLRNLETSFITEYSKFYTKFASIKIANQLQKHYANLFLTYAKSNKDTAIFILKICYDYSSLGSKKSNKYLVDLSDVFIENDKFYFNLSELREVFLNVLSKVKDIDKIELINKIYSIEKSAYDGNDEMFIKVFTSNINLIVQNHSLLTNYLIVTYHSIDKNLLQRTLTDKYVNYLFDNNIELLAKIYLYLENTNMLLDFLDKKLEQDPSKLSTRMLKQIGKIYHSVNESKRFNGYLKNFPFLNPFLTSNLPLQDAPPVDDLPF